MSKSTKLKMFLRFLLFEFTFLCAGCIDIKNGNPNILFIVVDDLRLNLGAYGDVNAYSPNIDNLASKSFVFTNVYAQQSLCAPSRNSFLTSRRPDTLHLYDFYSYWRHTVGNYTTMPEYFKDNGYYTYSIGKVFHEGMSSNFTDDYPYSWSAPTFHPKTEKFKESKVCEDETGTLRRNIVCPVRVLDQPLSTLPDLESAREAINFLKDYKRREPYFLAVGFHKPHVPLKYPYEYLNYHPLENIQIPVNIYRPPSLPVVAWNPWNDIRRRDDIAALNLSYPFGEMPMEMTRLIIQSYSAAVTYVDDLIGEIMEYVSNDTIVVLIGDNGVSMGEHAEFSKFSNYDVAVRVPLIMRIPQFNENMMVRSNKFVELVDLFPTLVDLSAIPGKLEICKPDKSNWKLCTEGRSLISLMLNLITNNKQKIEDTSKKAVFFQYPRPGRYPTKKPDSDRPHLKDIKIMGYTIRTNEFKYTEWVRFNKTCYGPDWSKVYDRELYIYALDPLENVNLISRDRLHPIAKRLSKFLRLGWRYYQ